MNVKVLLSSLLLLSAVGCTSKGTVREFNVGFDAANTKLRTLYPSVLTLDGTNQPSAGAAKLGGQIATIRRDELSKDWQVTIQVVEYSGVMDAIAAPPARTSDIVLKAVGSDKCQVSVLTSTATKAVLIPPRDEAYEQKQMDQIAEALKK